MFSPGDTGLQPLHYQQPGAVICVMVCVCGVVERDMRVVQIASSGVSLMVITVGCPKCGE